MLSEGGETLSPPPQRPDFAAAPPPTGVLERRVSPVVLLRVGVLERGTTTRATTRGVVVRL
eukprot:COSAG06_NODE_67318_length_252_cov_0.679739_1_plen_60_part_10